MSQNKLISKFTALGGGFFAFLRMNICFSAFNVIVNVFVNTFLLKADLSSSQVMLYNAAVAGLQPLCMIPAVILSRKTAPRISQRLGFLVYAVCFIFIMIKGAAAAENYLLIGALLSCGAGFYYVTYSLQIMEYTTDSNRDSASGISNTISAIISIVFPLLSGILLSCFSGFTGYRILFGIVLGLVLAALFFSMRLTPIKNTYDCSDNRTHLKEALKYYVKTKTGKSVGAMMFFHGMRCGTMTFFISILIYQQISNEMLIGVNNSIGNVLSVLSAIVYGIVVNVKNRSKSIAVGAGSVILCAAVLYFRMSPVTLILLSAVNSAANLFIGETQCNLYFAMSASAPELKGIGAEVHTVNEFFLAIGKVVGILITMLMPESPFGAATAIILLTSTQFISSYIVSRVRKSLDS